MGSLLDKARTGSTFGQPWTPHKNGETGIEDSPTELEGKILTVTYQESDYQAGVQIPRLEILNDADGEVWSVAGFHTALRQGLERAGAKPNARVAIVYEGEKKNPKNGRKFQSYSVAVEGVNTEQGTKTHTELPDEPPF